MVAHILACTMRANADAKQGGREPCAHTAPTHKMEGGERETAGPAHRQKYLSTPSGEYTNYEVSATQRIPLEYDGRSLGAHADTTERRRGTTLTKRMENTMNICRRIGGLPVGLSTTAHLIAAKALPRALHGCECTSVNVDAARRLRTAASQAMLGPHYSSSSPEIVLQGPPRAIVDPELRILDLRLVAMRRGIHKNIRRGQH